MADSDLNRSGILRVPDARYRMLKIVGEKGLEEVLKWPLVSIHDAFDSAPGRHDSAEYRVLSTCANDAIIQELHRSPVPFLIQSQARRLATAKDLTEAAAEWGLTSWAIALGDLPAIERALREQLPRPFLTESGARRHMPNARRRVIDFVRNGGLRGLQEDHEFSMAFIEAFDDVSWCPEFCALAACTDAPIVFKLKSEADFARASGRPPRCPDLAELAQPLVAGGFTTAAAQWAISSWAMAFGLVQASSASLAQPIPHPWVMGSRKSSIMTTNVARHLGCWPADGFFCTDCQRGTSR